MNLNDSYRCKGSHVVQARIWVNERLGEGTFEQLISDSGPPWNAPLLPSTWYDVGPLTKALKHVAAKLGRNVQDVTREIARRNALNDLKTLYRVFLSIAAPVRVMTFTPQLWSTYVKFGEAKAVKNDQGHYIGECSGVPAAYLDWACGAWLGFVPTTIEVAGGKDVQGRIIKRWSENEAGGIYTLQCEITYQ